MDGRLAQHFVGVGAKRISATEAASAGVSRGHELSASGPVLEILGRVRTEFRCRYLYLGEFEVLNELSSITLYNSREWQTERSPEWRLYYPMGCEPMEAMNPGDWCWVALSHEGTVTVVVASPTHEAAPRLDRLFGTNLRGVGSGTPHRAEQFRVSDLDNAGDSGIDVEDAETLILLGLAPVTDDASPDRLLQMIQKFGGEYPLPSVSQFARFGREVCETVDPREDPDRVLYDWTVTTNELYFLYERHVVQPLLDRELADRKHIDVDVFFSLATRLKNSRFSRAGKTFESHISALLTTLGIRHGCPPRMTDGSKPDFLFPSVSAYDDPEFADELITFLAAKTTTKERWRQVVTEATRTPIRHLVTLDREMNADVLNAMSLNGVVPVVPQPLQREYPLALTAQMLTVREFLLLVEERQTVAIDSGLLS